MQAFNTTNNNSTTKQVKLNNALDFHASMLPCEFCARRIRFSVKTINCTFRECSNQFAMYVYVCL